MAKRRADGESKDGDSTSSRASDDPQHVDRVGAHFAIEGHHFVAIPQSRWATTLRNGDGDAKAREAGFVRLDGVRHVLIEHDTDDSPYAPSSVSSLLTGRELQIAYSVADGKGDKVIAYELGISEYTVREHMRRIFHKLKVSKRAALVAQLIMARFEGGGLRQRATPRR